LLSMCHKLQNSATVRLVPLDHFAVDVHFSYKTAPQSPADTAPLNFSTLHLTQRPASTSPEGTERQPTTETTLVAHVDMRIQYIITCGAPYIPTPSM
jgi:hypothetical protein